MWKVAQQNIDHAGLASIVEIIVGPAVDSMSTLQPHPPFDFVFIDADKEGNVDYFREAKRLVRSKGVIIGKYSCRCSTFHVRPIVFTVDNVVRYGQVANPSLSDNAIEGNAEITGVYQRRSYSTSNNVGDGGRKRL